MLNAFITSTSNDIGLVQELKARSTSTSLFSLFHDMSEAIADIEGQFLAFTQRMSAIDPNWQFWSDYVQLNAFSYIALYVALRSSNWALRVAAIKTMAPIFLTDLHTEN